MLVSPISFMIIFMLPRIGIFLLLVGSFLIIFAFSSGNFNAENIALFCAGLPMALLGITLWFRYREKLQSQRFRLLRRSIAKNKKKEN